MKPHCLSVFLSLKMMLVIVHAALPPELYWKMVLPSTPVPKAISELLNPGEDVVSRGKRVDAENQPQNSFRLFDGAKEIPSQDVTNLLQYKNGGHDYYQLYSKTKTGLYFFEEALRRGNKLNVQFSKIRRIPAAVPILPGEIAEQIPFSLDKMKEILAILSVKPDSKNAEIVEKTIAECESPPMEGEEQFCATSLESLVDSVASKLGKNVLAMSTEVEFEKETQWQNLSVEDGVKKLADDGVAACHPLAYPYAVFLCHKLQKTSAYFVPLEGEEGGSRVKAVAVCHRDTSKWNPDHVAFRDLNVKPGTVPVCHVLPEGHFLWVPK